MFLFCYFCLLIIIAKAIIKANVMIVTNIRLMNNNLIVKFKTVISIICTYLFFGGKADMIILIYFIINIYKKVRIKNISLEYT